MPQITVSTLPKTWLFDIDGTLLAHNGHLDGADRTLPGTRAFFDAHVGAEDVVILLTAREEAHRAVTEQTLREAGIRFDIIHFGLPKGERICVNDAKPKGLQTALAVNLARDAGLATVAVTVDASL
jgi:FMN phosphatase YigB (HAD superfamily)